MGTARTRSFVDGEKVNVKWNHMKVKTPIPSVRQLVRDRHEVCTNSNGVQIKRLKNGNDMNFFDFESVNCLKMKIAQPGHTRH